MRGPITTAAWRRIRAWRDEWQALGARQLPVLVDGIGTKLSGTEALRYLGEHKGRDDAKLNRVLPDPVTGSNRPSGPQWPGPRKWAVCGIVPAGPRSRSEQRPRRTTCTAWQP